MVEALAQQRARARVSNKSVERSPWYGLNPGNGSGMAALNYPFSVFHLL